MYRLDYPEANYTLRTKAYTPYNNQRSQRNSPSPPKPTQPKTVLSNAPLLVDHQLCISKGQLLPAQGAGGPAEADAASQESVGLDAETKRSPLLLKRLPLTCKTVKGISM